MMTLEIPGRQTIRAAHLVLDFNGTLAVDGHLVEGVAGQLVRLSQHLELHVLTADTFGTTGKQLEGLPVTVKVIDVTEQDRQKADYVMALGADRVIAVGNGRNDVLMLKGSALGIGVIQAEGAFYEVLQSSQVVCTSITDALSLLLNPKRLEATLRN